MIFGEVRGWSSSCGSNGSREVQCLWNYFFLLFSDPDVGLGALNFCLSSLMSRCRIDTHITFYFLSDNEISSLRGAVRRCKTPSCEWSFMIVTKQSLIGKHQSKHMPIYVLNEPEVLYRASFAENVFTRKFQMETGFWVSLPAWSVGWLGFVSILIWVNWCLKWTKPLSAMFSWAVVLSQRPGRDVELSSIGTTKENVNNVGLVGSGYWIVSLTDHQVLYTCQGPVDILPILY